VLGFAIAGRERRLTRSVIVVLAVAIALAVLPESLNRFTSGGQGSVLSQILSSGQGLQLGTWQGRVDAWEYLLTNYFWKNPMVGTGLGSTAPVFRGGTAFITGAGAPHSEYVRFLCETGVVGVLLFCATLGAALAACWRAARTDEQTAGFARAAFGAVLALTVVSVSDNTVQLPFEFAAPIAALVASATTRPRLIAAGQAGSLGVEQAPAWAGSARLVRTRGKS
jgi:O-antigen ligase